ncbi:MAG: hypothetical protein ACYC0V_20765, partial [Armatimonadota bacterium]
MKRSVCFMLSLMLVALFVAGSVVPALASDVVVAKDTFATSAPSTDLNFENSAGRQSGTLYTASGPWGYDVDAAGVASLNGTELVIAPGVAGQRNVVCATVDALPSIVDGVFDVSATMGGSDSYAHNRMFFIKQTSAAWNVADGSCLFMISAPAGTWTIGTNWGGADGTWLGGTLPSIHGGAYNVRLHVNNSGANAAVSVWVDGAFVTSFTRAKFTNVYPAVGCTSTDAAGTAKFSNLTVSYTPVAAGVVIQKDSFITSAASTDLNFERDAGRQSGTLYDASGPWGYTNGVDTYPADGYSLSGTGLVLAPGAAGQRNVVCATTDALPSVVGGVFDVSATMDGSDSFAQSRLLFVKQSPYAWYLADGALYFAIDAPAGTWTIGTNWGGEGGTWLGGTLANVHSGAYNVRLHVNNSGANAVVSVWVDGTFVTSFTRAKFTSAYPAVGCTATDAAGTAKFTNLTVNTVDSNTIIQKDSFATSNPSTDINFEANSGRQSGAYYTSGGSWGYDVYLPGDASLSGTGLLIAPGTIARSVVCSSVDIIPLIPGGEFDVSVKANGSTGHAEDSMIFLKATSAAWNVADGSFLFSL